MSQMMYPIMAEEVDTIEESEPVVEQPTEEIINEEPVQEEVPTVQEEPQVVEENPTEIYEEVEEEIKE